MRENTNDDGSASVQHSQSTKDTPVHQPKPEHYEHKWTDCLMTIVKGNRTDHVSVFLPVFMLSRDLNAG